MRIGSLSLLALAVITLVAALFIPTHDNMAHDPVAKSVTVQGELYERNFQGIPGTTPPSAHSVTANGTTYYLLFSDDATRTSVTAGTDVEVKGTLKLIESEAPNGAKTTWTAIEVKSIQTLP